MDREQERRVVEALVGTGEHRTLYLSNAWFKASVDQLVAWFLPTFLTGLAGQAKDQAEKMERDIAMAKEAMSLPTIYSGLADGRGRRS